MTRAVDLSENDEFKASRFFFLFPFLFLYLFLFFFFFSLFFLFFRLLLLPRCSVPLHL